MQLIRDKGRFRRRAFCSGLAFALSLAAASSNGQTFTPYSQFNSLTQPQLTTLQVKLTYVGPQSKALSSVLGTESSNPLDISVFVPFQRPGISYSNDEVPPRTFLASAAQLEQMIDNVGTLSAVTGGGVQTPSILSFALYSATSGGIGFEAVLNPSTATALLNQMRAALVANPSALMAINTFGCAIDANPAGLASDVTSSASIQLSGVRLDREGNHFVGTLTIENIGPSAIAGPISVVIALPPNVHLANLDGYTCRRAPAGRRYLDVLTSGALGVGQSLSVEVELENPDREQIAATFQVLAGTGSR